MQDRLYACAAERQQKMLLASTIPEEDRTPAISDTSRRLAERANAGLSLQVHPTMASNQPLQPLIASNRLTWQSL